MSREQQVVQSLADGKLQVATKSETYLDYVWFDPVAVMKAIAVRISRSRSSKVVDFSTNRKGVYSPRNRRRSPPL